MTPADENGPEPAGDDILAAEFVLGVLPADERQAAARRIESDPAFARLVDAWEVRLAPMAEAYEEADPPASVKQALDRRLFAGGSREAERTGGFWQSLALWRGLTVVAVAVLAIVVAVTYVVPPAPTPAERLVASLSHEDTDVHYFIVYDSRTRDLGLSHVTGARPEGRDFELWVIEGDQQPQSVGVIPAGSNVHLQVSEAVREKIEAGAVFAISTEPPGGSPTGQPTGSVVALGDLKSI